MVYIESRVIISGPTFSPKTGEERTKLNFERKQEPGEIETRGRYRGEKRPYGSADLYPPKSISEEKKLEWVVSTALQSKQLLEECGVDEFIVDIAIYYDSQCNTSFSPDELNVLAKLGADVRLSVYDYPEHVAKMFSQIDQTENT